MTQYLPPNLLALFAPREPIPYLPPVDKLPHEKKNVHNYLGVADFVRKAGFEDPKDTPPPVRVETREERLERKRKEKVEQTVYKLEQEIAMWEPHSNDGDEVTHTGDPFKSLFVGRINYDTSESKLRREFGKYGDIKAIYMVHDRNSGKPRGYCFIEYEHERDMHDAYKKADGMKIDGRRVLVDVERGRTVKGWLPRRLGGGLGGTRRGGNDVNVRHSGREDGPRAHRGHSRERGGYGTSRRSRSRSRSRSRGLGGSSRRRRSRSRSRERRRRRSRSRDRRRSRSRDRKRSRRASRSRSRDRKRDRRERGDALRVKEEPGDDFGYNGVQIKQEMTDEADQERKPFADYPEDGQY